MVKRNDINKNEYMNAYSTQINNSKLITAAVADLGGGLGVTRGAIAPFPCYTYGNTKEWIYWQSHWLILHF